MTGRGVDESMGGRHLIRRSTIIVPAARGFIAARKRALIHLSESQNHRCAYCGVRMLLPRSVVAGDEGIPPNSPHWHARKALRYRQATADHLIPKCLGGTDDRENVVAACLFCNEFRGNNTAERAWTRIRRMVQRQSHPHIRYSLTGYWPNGIKYLPTVPKSARAAMAFAEIRAIFDKAEREA